MTRGRGRPLIVLALAALLLAGCADGEPDSTPTHSPTPASTTESSEAPRADADQDPQLREMLEQLIVEDVPDISLVLTDDVVSMCESSALACYAHPESTIYLSTTAVEFQPMELLAHEYLHHVWLRDDLDADTELIEALNLAYSNAEGLGALVPPWQTGYVQEDGSIQPIELFSYACTGLQRDQMEPELAQRCGQYLEPAALPINRHVTGGDLAGAVTRLRVGLGLPPLEDNPYAAAASQARAELFTPYSQVPLDVWPGSVTQHLNQGCTPSRYAARLTRPYDVDAMVGDLDRVLDGDLSSERFTSVGFAVSTFDYIDAAEVFGDRTIRVNTTLVVVTLCE
ncbi:MAG: hypothetical protein ACK5H2_03405 [Beutenbergiaceae bacterium]